MDAEYKERLPGYVSDDKGNTTSYTYDNLSRTTQTTFADGTTTKAVYDKDSNLTQFTDNNGTVLTHTFDAGFFDL